MTAGPDNPQPTFSNAPDDFLAPEEEDVYVEGVVSGRRVYGIVDVVPGLRFTSAPDDLRQLAESPPDQMRVFLGFAGWGPGQLAQEIAAGAWLLAPVSPEVIFETPEERVWERVLLDMGINPAMLVSTQGIN